MDCPADVWTGVPDIDYTLYFTEPHYYYYYYRGADKSLAPPGRKQATATEDFDVHISYL